MEKIKTSASWILRVAVAALFIYAGALKLMNPALFYRDILNYQIAPEFFAYISAYFLPPFEILAGAAVLFNASLKTALVAVSAMLAVFIIALASTITRGLDISCGCFGSANPSTAISAIAKDVAMLAACFAVALLNRDTAFQNHKSIYE